MTLGKKPSLHIQSDWQCPTCRLAARVRDGVYSLPNNPLTVAAIQALCAGGPEARGVDGGWRNTRTGEPVYEFWNGSGGRILVHVSGDESSAWSDVASYSVLTLETAVALLAALASDPFRAAAISPHRGAVWLGAPAILAMKDYKRFGAERDAFADMIDHEIAKLLRLRFEIRNYPAFDPGRHKWNRDGVSRTGVQLFEVDDDERASAPDERDCGRSLPLRFGAWAEHWLNAGGPVWLSSLPQEIMWLDHRCNRGADALAKKIGVLISLNWGAARRETELRMDMRTLLRRIGELPRPGTKAIPHGGRLADRVEEALLRLCENGVTPNTVLGGSAIQLRAENRHWLDAWLDAQVAFRRPTLPRIANVS